MSSVAVDNTVRRVSVSTSGSQGPRGAMMLSGQGAPEDAFGNNGDFYLDRSNGGMWEKFAGVWDDTGDTAWGANAEASADLAQQFASDAATVSGVNVPIYASVASAEGAIIVAGVKNIKTQFRAPSYADLTTLNGGAEWSRWSKADIDSAGLASVAYFRSTDRFMPDGSTHSTNGGYWVFSGSSIDLRQLGLDPTGSADNTQKIRDALHAACVLKLPIRGRPADKYKFSDQIYVGSKTAASAAANIAASFDMEGVTFLCAAGSTEDQLIVRFNDSVGLRIKNCAFDMSLATVGGGQFRLDAVERFDIDGVYKVKAGAALTGGSSAVSIRTASGKGSSLSRIICIGAGPTSAAAFLSGVRDLGVTQMHCEGGQEVVDLSFCDRIVGEGIYGKSLTGDGIDFGASSNCFFRSVYIDGCARGITIKTETGAIHAGSNNNTVDGCEIHNWTEAALFYGGGSTVTQTVDGNVFRNIRGSTSVATSSTYGLKVTSGDLPGHYNTGMVIEDVNLTMNAGKGILCPAMTDYVLRNIRIAGTTIGMEYSGASTYHAIVNGTFEDVFLDGDFNIAAQRKVVMRRIKLGNGGKFALTNMIGIRCHDCETDNTPADAFDLVYTSSTDAVTDKDVVIQDFRNRNNSLTTAGRWAMRIRHSGAGSNLYGIRVIRLAVVDDQGVATSGIIQWGNATFDYCEMSGVEGRNGAAGTTNSYYAPGVNSLNDNNRLGVPDVTFVNTDAAFSWTRGSSSPTIVHTGTLTANRTMSLATTGAIAGKTTVKVIRTGAGAFNLNVGTGPLKSLTTGTWGKFMFNGSAWILIGSGVV